MAERDYLVIRASDDFDPSITLRASVVGVSPSIAPSASLRAGIAVTTMDRPGGVAATEEEKAV